MESRNASVPYRKKNVWIWFGQSQSLVQRQGCFSKAPGGCRPIDFQPKVRVVGRSSLLLAGRVPATVVTPQQKPPYKRVWVKNPGIRVE